jgi:hypothetical protein
MLYEAIAAALVALAVIAALVSPLGRPGEGAPAGADELEEAEDTPRGVALAALREIEFDRATGKLSDEDYAGLKARYTAEALALLRHEDGVPPSGRAEPPNRRTAEPTRPDEPPSRPLADARGRLAAEPDPIEAMIADRVRQLGETAVKCPACGPRPETDALFCSSCGRSLSMGGCAGCGTPLVPGSRYCDGCGAAVVR